MEKYRRLTGHAYFYTQSLDEIPPKTRKAMEQFISFSFEDEPLLVACGIDDLTSHGKFWVLVTEKRVLSYKHPNFQQNLFSDLTGVERSYTGDIVLLSMGNKSDLFHFMVMPNKKLINRLFKVINDQWQKVKSQQQTQSIQAETGSGDVIDKLERLAKLKEQGLLSDEEFETQKKKLLES